MRLTRRSLIVGGVALAGAGSIATILNFAYPRRVRKAGDEFRFVVDKRLIPERGASPYLDDHGRFALVNLLPEEIVMPVRNGNATGGLLALSRKCNHLGCTLPWAGDFSFPHPFAGQTITGWFRCACHASTYDKAGIRVFGPTPRSLDTFEISVRGDGNLVVRKDRVTEGSDDNAGRAVPYDQLPRA